VRVLADGQTHRQTDRPTDANRFYNLSHAICYSYGTDKNGTAGTTFEIFGPPPYLKSTYNTIQYNIKLITRHM